MMGCILLQYLHKGNNNNHFAVKPTTRREDFSLSPHTRDNLCKPMLCSVHSTAQSHYKILHKHGMSILSWVSPAWLM